MLRMTWSSLKQQNQSQWVRSSYLWLFLVPVVANALSSMPQTASLEFGGGQFNLTLALPFSWKLFYCGSVCFSFAGFIYLLACPLLVRSFEGYSQYIDVGRGSRPVIDYYLHQKHHEYFRTPKPNRKLGHFVAFKHFIKDFTTGDNDWRGVDCSILRDDSLSETEQEIVIATGTRKAGGTPLEIIPEKFPEAFWTARNAADESWPKLRGLCTTLYIIGYVLFLWVAFEGFISVYRML